ncbi:MAG: LLM class flavin-dependent oxidoreductase, partial [Actinobacteria bacterium]|nr:LLM class flavin-dependent oxidoreductase [Actinomycetota bacterium]
MLPHGRDEVLAWCLSVDEGPWASLAVPERVTYPSHHWSVQLSAAAALTERVRLWTTIIVLPAHDEVDVAKQLASVDRLSEGRLTVGVGVGGRDHDYRAIGASTEHKWQRLDDQVARMRSIWAGEPPFEGADPVGPPPVQPGGPPLISGSMGPKAMARAARWASGVDAATSTFGVDVRVAASTFDAIRTAWREAGRDDAPHISASLWYALGDGAEERIRSYAYDYLRIIDEGFARAIAESVDCFTPAALRSAVSVLDGLGCDELFLVPTTTDVAELDRTREALGT